MTPIDLRAALADAFDRRPPRGCADERELRDRTLRECVIWLADRPRGEVRCEHRLDARSRLDLFVDDDLSGRGIAVEVKIDGALGAVTRQLMRYADHDAVTGILLVTTRATHRALPETMRGKPVACLWVGSWLL